MEDECTGSVLLEMAEAAGLPRKGAYRLSEVSRASGVSMTTLRREAVAGSLKTFLPPGYERGKLVRPQCFDEWWMRGEEDA